MKTIRRKTGIGLEALFLGFVYTIMLVVCVYLNPNDGKYENLIINGVMFGIVFVIFLLAEYFGFRTTNKLREDLDSAIEEINRDFEKENKFLWDFYNKKSEPLFKEKILTNLYETYKNEMQYLKAQDPYGTKAEIEDYINRDLIDDVAKKNLLNLIPGAMTGMGILGTFIGLSIGLQNFNTGTSEEIARSIAPLMDGIKVAFHTSIFGMVFSLTFNLLYKRNFELAYQKVEKFISVYHKCVSPDSENDNMSKIISGQQEQIRIIADPIVSELKMLNENMTLIHSAQQQQYQQTLKIPGVMEEKLSEQIIPQFTAMNNNFEEFAKTIGDTQLKGMEGLIDRFTTQTSEMMLDSFRKLKNMIDQTCDLQKKNGEYMQNVLSKVHGMTMNIQEINDLSQKTVVDMSGYVEKVENLQSVITENVKSFGKQMEQNVVFENEMISYVDSMKEYQKQCTESTEEIREQLQRQVDSFEETEKKIMQDVDKNMQTLMDTAKGYNEDLAESSRQQIESMAAYSNSKTEDIARVVSGLEAAVKEYQKQCTESTEEIREQLQRQVDSFEKTEKKIMQDVDSSMQTLMETADGYNKTLAEASRQQIESITDYSNSKSEDMMNAALKMEDLSKDFNEQLKNNLNEANTLIHDNFKGLSDTLNNEFEKATQNMTQEFDGVSQKNNKELEEVLKNSVTNLDNSLSKNISEMTNQISGSTKQMKNSATELVDIMQKFDKQMETQVTKMLETFTTGFSKDVSGMLEKLSSSIETLGASATNLGKISKDYDKQLEKSLTNTFKLFDEELRGICAHLSGTIAEVEVTTGRVPKVIAGAYEAMAKGLNDIEIQMKSLKDQIIITENQIHKNENN